MGHTIDKSAADEHKTIITIIEGFISILMITLLFTYEATKPKFCMNSSNRLTKELFSYELIHLIE